jgi:HlyD family secretion protein
MNLNQRTFIIIGAVVIAAIVLLAVLVPRLMSSEANATTSETAVVRRGNLIATVSATGAISPLREAQLAFSATGTLTKLDVKQGDLVKAGQVLASLDTRELELQLAQAEASLAAAQARFDQLKNPSLADVAAAQAGVASAEAALMQLRQPTQNDLLIAKADLDKARAALDRAQADYDRIGGASNPLIGMTPQALTLQQASLDYQKALALFNAKINPTDSQLKQAQSALEQARSQLARLNNPNPNEIKNVQAAVDQARAARDLAKLRLDYAIIKAPFDGAVTRVDADLGSTITTGRVVIAIADVTEYRVKLNIDETDIAKIKLGQEVLIGLDAYPDVSIAARVTDVASTATTVQGVVNYIVTVTLSPGQAPIKIGMTADANIVIDKKDNVLLAPNRAIRAAGNQHFVTIPKSSDQLEEIEVKIGMANDQETEIVSGLSEGQTVIIPLIQQLPGGGFGMPRR